MIMEGNTARKIGILSNQGKASLILPLWNI
jgi:hypothetical protein